MSAKIGSRFTVVLLVAIAFISGRSLSSSTVAQAAQTNSRILANYTTSASPMFEGGATGTPMKLTVEIRADDEAIQFRPVAWQRELPSQLKAALEAEFQHQLCFQRLD